MTDTALAARAEHVEVLATAHEFGIRLEPSGLALAADAPLPSYEAWERIGRAIAGVGESWQWWTGDWINWGEELFGEEAAQATDTRESRFDLAQRVTGLPPGTLHNIASICTRVARGRRRTPPLSFWTHAEVAALEPEEQAAWLERAIANGWSVHALRAAVREERHGAGGIAQGGDGGDGGRLAPYEQLERAARLCFHQGRIDGDEAHVPLGAWHQLAAALGEE